MKPHLCVCPPCSPAPRPAPPHEFMRKRAIHRVVVVGEVLYKDCYPSKAVQRRATFPQRQRVQPVHAALQRLRDVDSPGPPQPRPAFTRRASSPLLPVLGTAQGTWHFEGRAEPPQEARESPATFAAAPAVKRGERSAPLPSSHHSQGGE